MRGLLLPAICVVFLTGCGSTYPIQGVLSTVDQFQEYDMPQHGFIEFTTMPIGPLVKICGDAFGCMQKITETEFLLLMVNNKQVFAHECNHVVFGPKHYGRDSKETK